MTDTRRDRIARVMRDHDDTDSDCSCGWEWAGFGLWRDAYSHHVADAVIAELGLRVETRRRSYGRWILPTVDRIQRRWVTDWKVGNDE